MFKTARNHFFGNTRGNLSITTGIVGVMLMTAVGATLDGGRMFTTKQKLQSVTDAAALMAAMPEGITADRRKALAESSIRSHFETTSGMDIYETNITVDDSSGQVKVAMVSDVPMLFGAVLGADRRKVSVSSVAEETLSTSMSALSISLVLDLSNSMGDRFESQSKIASVYTAISEVFSGLETTFGGGESAAANVSTGVYPYNWGAVDGETVALEPGTSAVMNSLSYVSLNAGSVPGMAFSRALEDQLLDAEENTGRHRMMIYITDGKVDEDKSEVSGAYLSPRDMFGSKKTKECQKIAGSLRELDEKFDPDTFEDDGWGSPLNISLGVDGERQIAGVLDVGLGAPRPGGNDDDDDDDEDENRSDRNPNTTLNLDDEKHAGHNHGTPKKKKRATRAELREEFFEKCQPIQTLRVAEVCEKARDQDISVLAINISGEDGLATNTTDMCVNGFELDQSKGGKSKKDGKKSKRKDSEATVRVLPSGGILRVSEDGQSFVGDASNLQDLREMLGAVLPEGETQRQVRLIR